MRVSNFSGDLSLKTMSSGWSGTVRTPVLAHGQTGQQETSRMVGEKETNPLVWMYTAGSFEASR